jgi:alkylation response protein AidB-like acyl-CoA dehydrogenase
MNFRFTDEQRELAAGVREILARECTPARVRAAWADGAPLTVWPHLKKAGVTLMTAPESAGGLGLGELEWVLVAEECGRAALAEPLVEHIAVAVPALPAELLREVVVVALDGTPFVAQAAHAELFLIERNGALLAVERRDATLTPVPAVDGARQLARVEFAKATPVAVDRGLAFDRGALAAAAQLLGLARHLLDTTVEYVKLRTQFGRPVGSFQAVKHHLADAHVAIERARPCVYAAAWALARGAATRSVDVSLAKALASDAARLAARHALQCHGAIGYSFEYDLHLWMKRVWALAAAWGDAAWHRARIGEALV